MNKEINKEIFQSGYDYVLNKSLSDNSGVVTKELLDYYLYELMKEIPKLTDLNGLCREMIYTAQNRRGMPNSIGDIDKLSGILFNFNPNKIKEEYRTVEALFDTIKKDLKPISKMDINNSHNYWVIFCKSIISIAKYLSRFKTWEEYYSYVKQFIPDDRDVDTDLIIALPLILKEEIFGYQFALACDFLRKNFSSKFVKPDVHIRDIFIGIGICDTDSSDYDVFRKVVDFSNSIEKAPFTVDFLFWVIGSSKFYKTDKYVEAHIVNCSKRDFVELVRTKGLSYCNKK